jgi:hypothetical protein
VIDLCAIRKYERRKYKKSKKIKNRSSSRRKRAASVV